MHAVASCLDVLAGLSYGMNEQITKFIHHEGAEVERDKKQALKEAAQRVFAAEGYKAASVAEIAREAGVAVGSFYNYYPSKDEVFLDVYVKENDRVRQQVMDEVDWSAEPVVVVGQLFDCTFRLISNNRIISEWGNPAIADRLHAYYLSDEGKQANPFHQFLIETFARRMTEAGFPKEKVERAMQAYELLYFVDMRVSERDFPGYAEAMETLVTCFVRGLFEQEN